MLNLLIENIIIFDLKELNTRASGEIIVRQALNELDGWEIESRFQLSENKDSQNKTIFIIQDFKSVLNKVLRICWLIHPKN